jgi:hypothetical protein
VAITQCHVKSRIEDEQMKDRKKSLAEARGDIRHFWGQLDQRNTPAREAMREYRLAQSVANVNNLTRTCGPVPSAMFGGKAGGHE